MQQGPEEKSRPETFEREQPGQAITESDAIAGVAVHELEAGLIELHELLEHLKRIVWRHRFEEERRLEAKRNFVFVDVELPPVETKP